MGKRVTFTKRELQKLSKTHEGRQHINATYIREGKTLVGVGVFFVVGAIVLTAIFFSFTSVLPLLSIFFGIPCIVIGANQISKYTYQYNVEEANEQRRIYEEQEKQRQLSIQRHNAELERINHLKKLSDSNIEQVDSMSGFEFEEFVGAILSNLGYKSSTTKKSGDFGVDIILEKDNERVIIQTKRYSKKVSVNAIQEITTAQNFYGIYNAWVVTNNYFTESAIKLAESNHIKLVNRDDLISLIIKSKKATEATTLDYSNCNADIAVSQSKPVDFITENRQINAFSDKVFVSTNKVISCFNNLDINGIYNEALYVSRFPIYNKQNYIPIHFFYIETAKYLHRLVYHDPKADEYSLLVCEKDFEILPEISNIMTEPYACPTATIACIILERAKQYQKVIDYCNLFITLHVNETSGKSFLFRKERIEKRLSNQEKLNSKKKDE